jgi:hypothetical protein
MRLVCGGCQRYLGTTPPYRDLRVKHDLCAPCALRERRELATVVISKERADVLPLLRGLLRNQSDVRLLVDRRGGDRRREDVWVERCRRDGPDRRRISSLRLV